MMMGRWIGRKSESVIDDRFLEIELAEAGFSFVFDVVFDSVTMIWCN